MRPPGGRREALRWALGLGAAVALFWATRLVWPARRPGLWSSDLRLYFYPVYDAAYGWLAGGRLPLWNPYQLCGLPWIGTLQGGFFYPPHVLYLLLPTHVALAASGLLHLVLIALSTAAFARRVGLGWAPGVLAALLFTLRGTVRQSVPWPYRLEAMAWLPLGALAVLGLARGDLRRSIALLAACVGLSWLAGGPQATVFCGYAWATLLGAALLGAGVPPRRWLGAGAGFAAALALGTLAGAVQLLPAFELASAGVRGTAALAVERMYPMGDPTTLLPQRAIAGFEQSFGILGLALVPAALLGRRHRALALWAIGVGAVAVAFALGPRTPLFGLYLALPALGWFRGPDRILVLADFGFALAAGVALDTLLRQRTGGGGPGGRGWSLAISGLPVACAVALAVHEGLGGAWSAVAIAGGVVAALLAARVLPDVRVARRVLAVAVLGLAAAELLAVPANRFWLPYGPLAPAIYRRHADTWSALAEEANHDRVWLFTPGFPREEIGVKLASRHFLRSIDDYEPLNLRRQAEYFTYFMEGATSSVRPNWLFLGRIDVLLAPPGRPPPAARRRLLDLAALRFMVMLPVAAGRGDVRAFVETAGLVPRPAPSPALALFENPHALPRAFVVYRTRAAPPPDELLARLADARFDPLVESYVEGDPGFAPAAGAPARGEPATIVRDGSRIVEVRAALDAPGLVVLADTYYEPGWYATVDGKPVPIVATNHLFRGVPAPPGRHRIRFEYWPWSVMAGAALSYLAAIVIAGLVVASPLARLAGAARAAAAAAPAAQARPAAERLVAVDYIKVAAILGVILTHASYSVWDPRSTVADHAMRELMKFSVPAFLLVSGFLYSAPGPMALATLRRRLARVLVPYLVASALVQALGLSGATGVREVAFQLVTGAALSIYYYVFAIVMCILLTWPLSHAPRAAQWAVLLGLCAYGVAAPPVPVLGLLDFFWTLRDPTTFYGYFLAGWLARPHVPRGREILQRHGRVALLFLAVCVVAVVGGAAASLRAPRTESVGAFRAVYTIGVVLLLATLTAARTPSRAVLFLSRASYTMYLYHYVFLLPLVPSVDGWPPAPRIATLAAAGLAGAALVSVAGTRGLGRRARLLLGA